MTRTARRLAAVLGAGLAIVVAGCLGENALVTPPPGPTVRPEPTPTVTVFELATDAWYGGFELTLRRAVATLDEGGGTVVLEVELRNPGDEEAELDGPIRLVAGGQAVNATRDTELPVVLPRGGSSATVTFDVGGDFDVRAAAVRIGRSDEHQVIVPLVAGDTPPVTLEPTRIEVAVDGQAGDLYVELYAVELRADLPDWRQELGRDRLALTLRYHATFRSQFPGGFAFTAENVALRLPGGTVIEPRRDGHSQSVLIIDPGNRERDLRSRFEIAAPGYGSYALLVRDDGEEVALPFEIVAPADPSASPGSAGSPSAGPTGAPTPAP